MSTEEPETAAGSAEAVPEPLEPEMLASGYLGYECFQNYAASEVFVQGLAGTVSREDTEAIIRSQKVMLQRFEKTNAMLTNCNALSAQRLQNTQTDFKRHVQMLNDVRKDLSHIFERIRKLKSKLAVQYPKQFAEAANRCALPEEEDEEPGSGAATSASTGSASASTGSAAAAAATGVRRRQHPRGGQKPASGHPHRHSYHAGVPLSPGRAAGEGRGGAAAVAGRGAAAAGRGGAAAGRGAAAAAREAQRSEPPPHSSSDDDDDDDDAASVSSTNS